MNYINEEDYIKAINDNPENRDYQLLFAEYLQEKGEDNLAEGWRVLIEKGKKPELWTLGKTPHMETSPEWIGWNWETTVSHNLSMNLFDVIPEKMTTDHPLTEKAFPTFFGAMQAAAVAYVRRIYDENYGKECPVCEICNGQGVISINFDISVNEVRIPMTYPVYPQVIDCPNCNGKGVTG